MKNAICSFVDKNIIT